MFEYTEDEEGRCRVPKDVISVRFKDGLRKIQDHAFHGCSNLREVIINDGLQKIGRAMFFGCTSLESITLPSTVTEICSYALTNCQNLREVILNDGLQKIGDSAFYNCTSLESITLPSTLTEIGAGAFNNCSNLREVIFNDGLQKIGDNAFNNCSPLETITLPPSLADIGFCPFNNLREVELNGVPQYFKSDAFLLCDALERFLFPTISYRLETIIQTSHWEDLEDKVNEVRGVVQWESGNVYISIATSLDNWNEAKKDLGKITRLVSYYELKEATSTFELALWKSKLDQVDATNSTNRATYRIDVPGPVKDIMLQYLDFNW